MTKKKSNDIYVNVTASDAFSSASEIGVDVAQSTLRNSLRTLDTAKNKVENQTQVSAIALARYVHASSPDGLDHVPAREQLTDVFLGHVDAIAVNEDGTKNDTLAGSLKSSGKIICQMAWAILAGHFFIGWCGNPDKKNYTFFEGQNKKDFRHNPNIHFEKVFKKANAIFPMKKDSSGNLNTNYAKDIHPVTNEDAINCYKVHLLRVGFNNDKTGFAPQERAGKVETVSNAKEALTAILGMMSFFKNQAFVDGQVTSVLWDENELDNLCTNTFFDTCHEFAQLVIQARTVADAQMAEHCLKKKEAEENAKLKADADAKLEAEEKAKKAKLDLLNHHIPGYEKLKVSEKARLEAEVGAKLAGGFDKIEAELEAEIAQIDAKNTQKNKAKSA